jgi:hypothetical protein
VLSGFGVEKAAHGIELTEIQSENIHSTCVLWVWGWNFVTFLRCKRRTRSRVRVARFYSKGSHLKPKTYMDSFYFYNFRFLTYDTIITLSVGPLRSQFNDLRAVGTVG